MGAAHSPESPDIHALLARVIEHFEHILPAQAAIQDFVHHNTLHGFQHLPFPQALSAARGITGASGYLPEEEFRALYRSGRITREDLVEILDNDNELRADEVLLATDTQTLTRRDCILTGLLRPLKQITSCQFNWQLEEFSALTAFQPDVPSASREHLLQSARQHGQPDESAAITDLWQSCLHALGLDHYFLHPEDLLDISPEQAEKMLSDVVTGEERSTHGQLLMDHLINREADRLMASLFEQLGQKLTLSGLIRTVTGEDIIELMRPVLIRHIGSFLDQGLAAWHAADRDRGFYAVWRSCATQDLAWIFEELPDWRDSIDALPDDPLEAILIELKWLGLEENRWEGYLERLALELPGWSGMFLWRHDRPGYGGSGQVTVHMADYLAVRLVLERLFAQRLCRQHWMIEASFDVIRWYFRHNRAEFMVRHALFNQHLPEYLVTLAQNLINCSALCGTDTAQWLHLAHMIWTWRQSPASDHGAGYRVHNHGWRLFRLSQHLGLCGAEVRALKSATVRQLFDCIDLDADRAGFIWLQAYERHYREQLFSALAGNHGRGRWSARNTRPEAQLVFCMDDREEGFRRHLEEHNPQLETLGAAGFFGVAINWRGLDDDDTTPLCPIVVTPAHEVSEVARSGEEASGRIHARRRKHRLWMKDQLHQETRRNLFQSAVMILLAAPAALTVLIGKLSAPLQLQRLSDRLRLGFDRPVNTTLALNARDTDRPATPQQPRAGFTDEEQADRVAGFLRTIGLQDGFAPLVVMMGHGSSSQNNPHLAAYDCGACSGRHGGPNARTFAAMANRPEIRERLGSRGIDIPDDTWFLGAEHDTCDEHIDWYDLDNMPDSHAQAFDKLRADLGIAMLGSAHERARRLASAPDNPTPRQALRHIMGRACDFSQARPELGHATNAAAFIGRRSMSQGAFLDRRVFLISYDPTRDPEGEILEAILLAAGPVGAGINLEYYFSTVNNEQYGCGSKITHNVTGLFGVMEGTASDLRTGLPRQMIEVHEAMRLQVVVEARTETVSRIYERQPPLQELIGNGWLLLAVKDPDSGAIHLFTPEKGFTSWHGNITPLPQVKRSSDWYNGHDGPLTPALIEVEGSHV